MFDSQLLFPGAVPATGISVLSPWFPRQGDSVRMTLDVTQINAATIEVKVFSKNSEDTGDGTDADVGNSISANVVGRTTREWTSVSAIAQCMHLQLLAASALLAARRTLGFERVASDMSLATGIPALVRHYGQDWTSAPREFSQKQDSGKKPEPSEPKDPTKPEEDLPGIGKGPKGYTRGGREATPDEVKEGKKPSGYKKGSLSRALARVKEMKKNPHLKKGAQDPATEGPCAKVGVGQGTHTNVLDGGVSVATIVCCPCCNDTELKPVIEWWCRIMVK